MLSMPVVYITFNLKVLLAMLVYQQNKALRTSIQTILLNQLATLPYSYISESVPAWSVQYKATTMR